MKIKVLLNNVKNTDAVYKGIALVEQWSKGIFPLEITVVQKQYNVPLKTLPFENKAIGKGNMVDTNQILDLVDGTDDVAFLIFDNTDLIPKPLNPLQSPVTKGITTPCQMCTQWYNDFPEVFAQFFLHELCHVVYFFTNNVQNDKTHFNLDPRFSQKQPQDWYLYLLSENKTLWDNYKNKNTKMKYKNFTDKEVVGLKPELVLMLDKARDIAGTPFIIGSGLRTPEQNKKAGGVANSAHLKGLAVDLSCKENVKRTKILRGLLNCGTDCFIEICGGHIHVDLDSSIHPMGNTMWSPDTD